MHAAKLVSLAVVLSVLVVAVTAAAQDPGNYRDVACPGPADSAAGSARAA